MRFEPTRVHAVLGVVGAIILIIAPNLFGLSAAAGIIPRILGVVILLAELCTENGLSLFGWISMRLHLEMDYVIGLFLIVSPWVFRFDNGGAHTWVPHLVLGLVLGLNALVTRTVPDNQVAAASRSRSRRATSRRTATAH